MKPNVMPVVTPLTMAEAAVLQAYATRAVPAELEPAARLEWAKTTQALTARGALQKTPEGIVVTPEGLAALLDEVGVEVTGTGSRSGEPSAGHPGAARRRSTAARTSGALSVLPAPRPS